MLDTLSKIRHRLRGFVNSCFLFRQRQALKNEVVQIIIAVRCGGKGRVARGGGQLPVSSCSEAQASSPITFLVEWQPNPSLFRRSPG